MRFHPSGVQSEVLHTSSEQAFVALPLLPACHREDVWLLALRHAQVRSPHQMERRQRGMARPLSGGGGPCLTVQQPGARCAGTEETRELETRGLEVEKCMTIQLRIRRASNEATRLGRGLPVQEDHQAPATLQRLVPHHGSRPMPMRCLCPRAAVLETAHGLAVDLPSLGAPCPTARRVRTGGEQHAVGVAPQCGAGMPIEADDFLTRLLLRRGAVPALRGEARRQARARRVQLLRGAVAPRVVRLGLRGGRSRRRLRAGERQSAPACALHHRERGNLQATCGTTRTAVADVPEPARLLAPLRARRRQALRPVPSVGQAPSATPGEASRASQTAPAMAGRWCVPSSRRSDSGCGR
jgi:hypothetical protein